MRLKKLSGTEKNHDNKVDKAVGLIHQLILPEKVEPEKFIFDMLVDLDVNMVSDHEKWGNYVHDLREYLFKRKEILNL